MNRRISAIVFCCVLTAGCASEELDKLVQAKDATVDVRNATTQAVAQAKVVAASLPEGSAERAKVEEYIAKAEQVIVRADQVLTGAEGAIRTIQTGELDPLLTDAVGDLPYGGWIVLALSLGLAGWKAWVAQRARGDLQTVIKSIDVAIPEKTPHLKETIRRVQGEAVTARVKALRT